MHGCMWNIIITCDSCDIKGIYHIYHCGHLFTYSQESLDKQLKSPSFILVDFAKMEAPLQMHLAFLALDQFQTQRQALPRPRFVHIYRCIKENPIRLYTQ